MLSPLMNRDLFSCSGNNFCVEDQKKTSKEGEHLVPAVKQHLCDVLGCCHRPFISVYGRVTYFQGVFVSFGLPAVS